MFQSVGKMGKGELRNSGELNLELFTCIIHSFLSNSLFSKKYINRFINITIKNSVIFCNKSISFGVLYESSGLMYIH